MLAQSEIRTVIPEFAPLKAFHLGHSSGQLHYRNVKIVQGNTVSARHGVELCIRGPHASLHFKEALEYGFGPLLSVVSMWGETIIANDKLVSEHRRHDLMFDIRPIIKNTYEFWLRYILEGMAYHKTCREFWISLSSKFKLDQMVANTPNTSGHTIHQAYEDALRGTQPPALLDNLMYSLSRHHRIFSDPGPNDSMVFVNHANELDNLLKECCGRGVMNTLRAVEEAVMKHLATLA